MLPALAAPQVQTWVSEDSLTVAWVAESKLVPLHEVRFDFVRKEQVVARIRCSAIPEGRRCRVMRDTGCPTCGTVIDAPWGASEAHSGLQAFYGKRDNGEILMVQLPLAILGEPGEVTVQAVLEQVSW